MCASRITLLFLVTLWASTGAFAQGSVEPVLWHDYTLERPQPSLVLSDRDAVGLPGQRPRLTMSVPLNHDRYLAHDEPASGAFSWSLEAWRLNTASLAHIQCSQHTMTLDSFLAEDCRFVSQPVPDDSVNLVQIRGEWVAAPGLRFGLGAFHSQHDQRPGPSPLLQSSAPMSRLDPFGQDPVRSAEGMDLNVSFGLSTERVGDFLVGLQVARYRQHLSLTELGLRSDPLGDFGPAQQHYANSAQLSLGWRLGSFGGDILGQHREAPLWLAGGTGHAPMQSFDLEFSWRPRNASLSVGISNVLDATPRVDEADARHDDPLEHVFGRIPYVRYKHDL